jgi:anti-sigma B factor antagonist
MNFTCDNREHIIIIHLTGNIDATSHSQFTSQPEFAVQGKDLILDFSGIEFMDSAGLGGLVLLIRSYRQAGRKCILAAAPPLVAKIFKITAIERMTQVLPSLESALQAAGGK